MDEMEFHLINDISRQQYWWTISEAVNTVRYSWWWAKTSPKKCRAVWVQINKPNICILLVVIYNYTNDTRIHERQEIIMYDKGVHARTHTLPPPHPHTHTHTHSHKFKASFWIRSWREKEVLRELPPQKTWRQKMNVTSSTDYSKLLLLLADVRDP